MLATVGLDDNAPLKRNEIENVIAKRDFAAKSETGKLAAAQKTPHPRFCVSRSLTHTLGVDAKS